MAGARRAAMQIAFFSGPGGFFTAGSAINISAARRQRFENGIKMFHNVVFAADHLAIAALESPDPAARADINIVQAFRGEFFCATNVVNVVGVSSVDEDVAFVELRNEIVQRGIHDSSGNHQPDRARFLQLFNKVIERVAASRAFAGEFLYSVGSPVIHHALVTVLHQPAHHVGAHSSEPDHAKLHLLALRDFYLKLSKANRSTKRWPASPLSSM